MFFITVVLILSTHQIHGYSWTNIVNHHSLFEVTAFNVRERAILYDLHCANDTVVFLNGVTNIVSSPMYVIVHECCSNDFEDLLYDNDIEYIKVHKDSILKEFHGLKFEYGIEDEAEDQEKEPDLSKAFLNWPEIETWVRYKLKKHPMSLKKITLGHTFGGHDIFVLKVSGNGANKPKVFILGGEQGRDKMSTAVILNFIDYLLTTYLYSDLINLYDLYFMPVFNPDGYLYSFSEDMFFNKNRKQFFPDKKCVEKNFTAVGVNIDRNWFYSNSGYVEDAECSSVFLGHDPLTEEEPKVLADYLNTIAVQLMAFINVRGFSSLLTVPYAQQNEFANNYAVLSEILLHASNVAFLKYNVSCNLCSTHNCFYNHTGNAPDWVKRNLNIPVVFTLYLKHADSFLPKVDHTLTLLRHFGLIIKETLMLAFDIYGPLFNGAQVLFSSSTISMLFLSIFALFY